jgi:hypothetical protein
MDRGGLGCGVGIHQERLAPGQSADFVAYISADDADALRVRVDVFPNIGATTATPVWSDVATFPTPE